MPKRTLLVDFIEASPAICHFAISALALQFEAGMAVKAIRKALKRESMGQRYVYHIKHQMPI